MRGVLLLSFRCVWEDRQRAQRCAHISSFFLSLTVTWQAGEGLYPPSELSTRMWGEYYSSCFLSLFNMFGKTDSGRKGAPAILPFFFR